MLDNREPPQVASVPRYHDDDKRRIEIYDTTLRDGTQGEGFNLSLQDKLLIARSWTTWAWITSRGDSRFPTRKMPRFFRKCKGLKLRHAKVSAFGMTRRRGIKAEDDPGMKALLEAETPVITLVGKTSDYQAKMVLNVTPEENLQMIADSVQLMRSAGRQVVYDAEHFFDTFRSNPRLRPAHAAGGAGGRGFGAWRCATPTAAPCPSRSPRPLTPCVREPIAGSASIRITTPGLAIANALAAIRAGASHAQGTINGVGERCGNMDLIPLIANLQLKYGHDCLLPGTLAASDRSLALSSTKRPISTWLPASRMSAPAPLPIRAACTFMRCRRMSAPTSTSSPKSVGNTRKILISEMSGASNIAAKAGKKFDIESDKATLRRVLEKVQDLENAGYQFEAAEASFELLLRKEIGRYRQVFRPGPLPRVGVESWTRASQFRKRRSRCA